MGVDTTSTHLIFFIAATVVAVAASGALTTVILDLSDKAEIRGDEFGQQLTSAIKVINDPANVIVDPSTLFYVKNVGRETLIEDQATLILDGVVITATSALLDSETIWRRGAVAEYTYTPAPVLGAGDHTIVVVTENGVSDELRFRVT